MSKIVKRLLVAAFFSASGFAGTFAWYKYTGKKSLKLNDAPVIANLISVSNDVQKKPVKKIIWEPVNLNEDLRFGEAVRTSAESEAKIKFLNSNTIIELEPDSAIVIEENDGKTSLDFLSGNILVKSDNPTTNGTSDVTLKNGDKKIALGNSEITLGKTKTGELNVQVLKGQVAGIEGMAQEKIKVLKPLSGDRVFLNLAAGEQAQVEFQPLSATYQVTLESGSTRSDLKPSSGAIASGEKGSLTTPFKIGKNFFRLVAKSSDPKLPELYSAVLRTQVSPKLPPLPLSPEKDAQAFLNKAKPIVSLIWNNPAGYSKIIVEIATSADLKQKIKAETVQNTSQYNFTPEKAGTYFWRVSGIYDDKKGSSIASSVQKFKVNFQNQLEAPQLELPKNDEKILAESISELGVTLTWKAAPGANKYKYHIERHITQNERAPTSIEKILDGETPLLQIKAKDLKPGTYSWSVTSMNSEGFSSKPTDKNIFTIQGTSILEWADGKTQDDFYYITLKPSVTLKWQKGDLQATNWELQILKDGTETPLFSKKINNTGLDVDLPSDGSYHAQVAAFDDRGRILARSVTRNVNVKAAPLLPAPEFAANLPKEIIGSGGGTASVQWQNVNGASKYILLIKSTDGHLNKELSYKEKSAAFKNLMPGDYEISLRSVDEHGRIGPLGETRKLNVPSQSNVGAPKLKGIKVK
jgi:hypothetical protein